MPNSFIRDYYNELSGVDLEYNELTEAAKHAPNKYGKLYPIYIVLFSNRNDFSLLIRKVTKSAYSHSAVSLDSTMNNMYSFSDVPYDAGVFGALGFVRESIWSPQYRNCEHFRVLVSFIDKAGRDAAQKKIDWFIKNYDKYTYNTIGLIQYYLKGKNTKNHDETKKSRFFCSEFVSYMIDSTEEVEGFENILQSPADLSVTRNAIDLGIYTVDGFDEKELIKRTIKAEKEFRKCDTLPEINLEESANVSTLSDAQLLNEAVAKIARKKVDKRAVQRYTYNIDWKKLYLKYIELFPDSDPNLRFELFCVIIKFYLMPKKAPTDNVTDQVIKQLENIHNMMNGGFIKMIDSEDSVIFFKSNDGDDIINYPPKIKNESADVLDEFIHTSQIEDPDERKAMMKKYGLRPAGYGQDTRKEDEERMKKSREWEKKIPLRQKKKIYREDGEGLVPGHEEVGDPDDVLPIEETVEYRLTKGFDKSIVLYHGSPNEYVAIEPRSVNFGTRLSKPRTSSFWVADKNAAAMRGLFAWMADNILDFCTNIQMAEDIDGIKLYVEKSKYREFIRNLSDCEVYVYEVIVPTKYVGRGHDPEMHEYTLDVSIFPRRTYTYTVKELSKFIIPADNAMISSIKTKKTHVPIMDKILYGDMRGKAHKYGIDMKNVYGYKNLPKEPKPTSNGWYGDNHVWNSLIVRGNKRYRERVEVLVHREDKVLLRIKSNSTYSIPGGSSEPGRSLKDQAIKECQEEVHITPKDLIYYGSYVKPYMNNSDYDWYICHYFVGKYDKPYTGKVRKEDQDDKMLKESKWYPVSEVDTMLSDAHLNALYDYWSRTLTETAVSDDTKGTDQDFHNVGKAAGWYKGWTADGCQFDLEGVAQDNDTPDSGADGAYRVEAPVDSQDEPWLGTVHNLNNPDKSVNEVAKTVFDDQFKQKELLKLSSFKKVRITKAVIDKYRKEYPDLKHVRCEDTAKYKCDGYIWLDRQDKLVCQVGSCEYNDDHTKWIVSLEIFDEFKGHGLAKQLLDFATKTMQCKYLSVNKTNEVAKHVYLRYGFKTYFSDKNMDYMTIDTNRKVTGKIDETVTRRECENLERRFKQSLKTTKAADNYPDKVLADPTNPTMVDKYRKLGYEFDPSRGTIRGRAQYMYYGVKINEPAEDQKFTIDIDQSGKGVCTDAVIKKLKAFIESRLNQVSTDNPEGNANIAKELLYAVDLIETYLINNVDKRSVYYCELINLRTLAIDFVAKVTETDASVAQDYERLKPGWHTITDGKLTTLL